MTTNKKLEKNLKKKRYDSEVDSILEEEEVKVKQGKPWTRVGTYSSYESAAKGRDTIVKKSPEYDTKIKRCGSKRNEFKVLKRLNKELVKKKKTKE